MSIDHLLETHGFVLLRDHPHLRTRVESATRRGRLRKLLPGLYTTDPQAMTVAQKVVAVCAWDPDAVVLGDAALHLGADREHAVRAVDVASPVAHRPQQGFRFSRRRLPPELVADHGGIRLGRPALVAVDLAATDDGSAIDLVLRSRTGTLDQMRAALRATARRRGNARRAEVVLDSRDEPWSQAERRTHRLLRADGLRGWRSNLPLRPVGTTYYGDVVFERERVVLEVDGFEVHSTRSAFELDRRRQNELQLAGWLVLRVTWLMLTEESELVLAWVRQAVGAGTAASRP